MPRRWVGPMRESRVRVRSTFALSLSSAPLLHRGAWFVVRDGLDRVWRGCVLDFDRCARRKRGSNVPDCHQGLGQPGVPCAPS